MPYALQLTSPPDWETSVLQGSRRHVVRAGHRTRCTRRRWRNADGAAARAAELGTTHLSSAVDVTDEDSVAALFEQVGPLDVVVNTAGFGDYGRITELPAKRFRAVIDVCLTGAFVVAKYAGRYLREGGSLVSITSLTGEVLDLDGGAHLKRYPDVLAHIERLASA